MVWIPAHLLVLLLVAVIPPLSAAAFRDLRRLEDISDSARRALYRQLTLSQWILAGLAVGAVALLAPPLSALGLAPATVQVSASLAGLVAVALLVLALGSWHEARRPELPAMLRQVAVILPRSGAERGWWAVLSLSAGICEEIVYRGFLIYYLNRLWPELGPVGLIALSSLVFGLGHLYQGMAGFWSTAVIGAVLAGLYLLSGSLWLPIALHAAVDLRVLLLRVERG